MAEKESTMTTEELDEFRDNVLEYEQLGLEDVVKKHRYERESQYFKDTWKRVKNILSRYDTKLVHFGEFYSKFGSYSHKYNVIQMRPVNSFIDTYSIWGQNYGKMMGTAKYYKILCHELCHLILQEEFKTTLLLDGDIEEIIVETICKDIMLSDICPACSKYDNIYYELNDEAEQYITERKHKIIDYVGEGEFWRECDKKRLYDFIDEVKEKVQEIWWECAPSGKKKLKFEFESSLNKLEL